MRFTARAQALRGDVQTHEVHAYLKYLFARSDFLDMEGLVPALINVGRYDYSQIQTLGTLAPPLHARPPHPRTLPPIVSLTRATGVG